MNGVILREMFGLLGFQILASIRCDGPPLPTVLHLIYHYDHGINKQRRKNEGWSFMLIELTDHVNRSLSSRKLT